jgi:uncharacterized protein (DUF58 family)
MRQAFVPAFRELLRAILARAPRIRAMRDVERRARRRALAAAGTFAGHRAYSEGDDVRLVDWNAYARTGELFVKLLEEEDRRTLTLLVDRTPSMLAGDPPRARAALRLAAILGGLALARLDGLHLVLGHDDVHTFQGAPALPQLLDLLGAARIGPQSPLQLAQVPLARGWLGRLCWVSDFAEPDAFAPALRLLRRHGRGTVGWLPQIADDRLPQVGGWVRVRDLESGREQALLVDAELRAALEAELRLLQRHQDAVFAEVGAALVRFPVPAEGDFRPGSWFQGAWTARL